MEFLPTVDQLGGLIFEKYPFEVHPIKPFII